MGTSEQELLTAMVLMREQNHRDRALNIAQHLSDRYERERIEAGLSGFWANPFPKIRFLCATKGHRIVTVQADDDHLGVLNPIRWYDGDGRPESGRESALRDANWYPWREEGKERVGQARLCYEVPCTRLTRGTRCAEHVTRVADLYPPEMVHTRNQVPCPRKSCRYDGRHTVDRLYLLYATAAVLGRNEFRFRD